MDDKAKNKTQEENVNPWKANDYVEKWNPDAYLKFFSMDENTAVLHRLHFQVSNVIKTLNTNLNKKSQCVLEYGGGPCLWPSLLLLDILIKLGFVILLLQI